MNKLSLTIATILSLSGAAEYPMPLSGWVDFTDRASWDANGSQV